MASSGRVLANVCYSSNSGRKSGPRFRAAMGHKETCRLFCSLLRTSPLSEGGTLRLSHRSEQIPGPGDTLQPERAALRKLQFGPSDKIGHDTRHEYLVSA